ncbi:MAG: amino acid adenylation domain-containing protein [Cyanomargarita calcarea GSE-NOS-MK-12-04C]|jgi:amino acid adenylation domain-containing protein/non-ribosomal peptide synthase protein (TIGR01720 family)|uniref:Amino acid adenylation domain-containing protein n=1 Tax=Cyanomargarita calcarea GSE-NOS-MK-12-04C TaxID=2839659 RepID=A0A951QMV0_9CYAN|nr:amino acid adenylation domain-containing protein [Cyanomargarita calcarea GSE-NOS-MK-12-04C]
MIQNRIITGFQVSPQQKHLWLLQQGELNQSYRSFCAILIEGNLNLKTLEKALYNIVHRHEILRTTFDCLPGMVIPLQVINDGIVPSIDNYDLSNLNSEEKQTKLEELFQEIDQINFDFQQGPLLHLCLVTLSLKARMLLVSLPALCADRVTLNNLVGEISQTYSSLSHNEESSDEPIQYVAISAWQNELLEIEEAEIGRKYWQKQNISHNLTAKLPFENQAVEKAKFQPQNFAWTINPELTANLKALVKKYDTSEYVFLLSCWQILLWRLTGESSIMVGIACDGRVDRELTGALGLLTKYLPINYELKENLQFSEVLQGVNLAKCAASEWQEYFAWEQILGEESFCPFSFDFEEQSAFSTADGSFSIYKQYACFEPFKVKLSFVHTQTLVAKLEYDPNLFPLKDIKRMTEQFSVLLESAIKNPTSKISTLDILSNTERQQLLFEFNNTKTEYPQNKCLHQLFEEQVKRTPENIAVVFEDQCLTYNTLNNQANQLAHYLQRLGVEPEVVVGICVERSPLMIIGLLAILKAGGAYLPLDPLYPEERLTLILAESQASVLLTQERFAKSLPAECVVCLDTIFESIINRESENNLISNVEAKNLAYVIYTSGSTGTPKGVMISHQAICNHMFWMQTSFSLTVADKVLQKTPFSFDASVWEFYAPLLVGAQLLIAQPERHQDSAYLVKLIAEQKVTTLQVVPSLLQMLLSEEGIDNCRFLKRIFCGGEALNFALTERVFANLDVDLHNLYGPTEACIDATVWTCKRMSELQIVPIGRPISNTQIYILDPHLQPVPIGVPGELHIGGVGLARGYLNRPDLTKEKFIPNPFSDETDARLYKTGDRARYLVDGNIEFLGRIDNQIKLRGFRIELGEIEALLTQHPNVREAVVNVQEEELSKKKLVAYVVPQQKPLDTNDLRNFLKKKLPEYTIPSAFVILENLPLTPNGKVDRRSLPAPPDLSERILTSSFDLPRLSEEKILVGIWSEILGVEAGIHDNFFELGGDSILSVRVVALANKAGLQLTPKQLFQHQTIAELASVVGRTAISVPAQQDAVTGLVPLTPIQQRFFAEKLSEPHHYNQSLLLEVPPDLKPQILEQVVQHLLVHHDALRLRFTVSNTGWQQVNLAPEKTVPFTTINLSDVPPNEQQVALESAVAQLQMTLNLSDGPLMRVALFDLGRDFPGRLLLIVHHLAVDGVSWRILLEDLTTIYHQCSHSEAIQLPSKTTSFKDWSHRLTTYSQSATLATELNYWLPQSQVTDLPVDYSALEETNTVASSARVSVSLTEEQTQILLQEVSSAYNTQINDVLLTALVRSFAKWTGKPALLVDLEGHGREELFDDVDLSRTVGWFTTLFPVLLDLQQTDGLGEALISIKEQLRRLPKRGIGYGLLRYLSQDTTVRSQLQALPQAQVSFNYLGQFDRLLSESAVVLGLAKESNTALFSPQGRRSYLLEVNGLVISRRLQMYWTYSQKFHQLSTIERLSQGFIEELQALIDHCQSPDAGGHTLSDFPLANLDEDKFRKISNLLIDL